MTIIVTTSIKEQQDMVHYIRDKLKSEYHNDVHITVVQSGLTQVDVYHEVKGVRNLAASYKIVLIPVTMSLEKLSGFAAGTNININRLLERLEDMKTEAIKFVNAHKVPNKASMRQKEALVKAAQLMFKE